MNSAFGSQWEDGPQHTDHRCIAFTATTWGSGHCSARDTAAAATEGLSFKSLSVAFIYKKAFVDKDFPMLLQEFISEKLMQPLRIWGLSL